MEITGLELDALCWAADLAVDDQHHLLNYGNGALDYGEEWPEVANRKAEHLEHLASVLRKLGADGTADNAAALAVSLRNVGQASG